MEEDPYAFERRQLELDQLELEAFLKFKGEINED